MRAWLKQSNKWYEKNQNINWNQNWKMNQGYMCLLYCLFVLFPFLWGGWRTGSLSEKKTNISGWYFAMPSYANHFWEDYNDFKNTKKYTPCLD